MSYELFCRESQHINLIGVMLHFEAHSRLHEDRTDSKALPFADINCLKVS